MRKKSILILMSTILFFSTNTFAVAIPTNWFSLENVNENENATLDGRGRELDSQIQSLFGVYNMALNKKSYSTKGGWELSELETDISISKQGLLGFGTLETESAVEIVWSKTNPETKTLRTLSDAEKSNPDAFAEDMAMKLQKMDKFKSNANMTKFKNSLIKKLKSTAELMSHVPGKNHQYSLDSFKIIISLDTEGEIISNVNIGASFTLEVLWQYNPKPHTVLLQEENPQFKTMLDRTLEDVTYASSMNNSLEGFSLDLIGIALAESNDGLWGISNSAFEASGVLYLKRNSQYLMNKSLEQSLTDPTQEVPFVTFTPSGSHDKSFLGGVFHFKRNRMRKGLIKTMKIANFFATAAGKTKTTKWNIDEIKTIFTITKHGIFGLGTASGGSSIEMFYHKTH